MTEIKELIERVGRASGPDRELDLAIGALWSDPPFSMSINQQRGGKPPVFKFTASIDAALALVERVRPGTGYSIIRPDNAAADVQVDIDGELADAPTVPLAILSALLASLSNGESESPSNE